MEHFSLRNECNALLSELNQITEKRNITKLGLDVRLQENFLGSVDELKGQISSLAKFLDNLIVNGIIQIEVSMQARVGSLVTMLVSVIGRGRYIWHGSQDKDLGNILGAQTFKTGCTVRPDEIQFDFNFAADVAEYKEKNPKLPFHKKKVLLAEDNEINAMVFSSFLEEWGCESTMAVNGEQAVNIAHEFEFDAILMDIFMPVLNGNQATKKIREFNRDIPIIALTASTRDEDIREAVASGANDYLLKPVSSANLFLVLTKYF